MSRNNRLRTTRQAGADEAAVGSEETTEVTEAGEACAVVGEVAVGAATEEAVVEEIAQEVVLQQLHETSNPYFCEKSRLRCANCHSIHHQEIS